MKHTAFTEFHEKLGARMEEFCGYKMPISYEGINEEHLAVRTSIGIFDVSHMGEFWVSGPNATSFIQKLTTNDVNALFDGKVQYTCFPNGKGGIVDDLLVYRFNAEKYLLVVNAANIEKDWDWCVKNADKFDLQIGKDLINASDDIAQLAIQGPNALKAMQKLTDENVSNMEYYTFKSIEFAGIKDVVFSTTGYTGSGGCEIYVNNENASLLWDKIIKAGEEYNIKPIGLGARDTLRLEAGFCLYGNDINDTTSPIEAGLGWITKFVDGNDFIDRDFMAKMKEEKPSRRLKGFLMLERGIPRQHYKIEDAEGNEIGEVTSGTMSPVLKQGVGMGYVKSGFTKVDTEIFIRIRNKALKARIVKTPFFK